MAKIQPTKKMDPQKCDDVNMVDAAAKHNEATQRVWITWVSQSSWGRRRDKGSSSLRGEGDFINSLTMTKVSE